MLKRHRPNIQAECVQQWRLVMYANVMCRVLCLLLNVFHPKKAARGHLIALKLRSKCRQPYRPLWVMMIYHYPLWVMIFLITLSVDAVYVAISKIKLHLFR